MKGCCHSTPGQLPSLGGQGGVTAEIQGLSQHLRRCRRGLRIAALAQGDGHKGVLALPFANADPAPPPCIDDATTEGAAIVISLRQGNGRTQGLPLGIEVQLPETPIGGIDEHHRQAAVGEGGDAVGATAIGMNTAAQVPGGWCQLLGGLFAAGAQHQG